MASPEAPIGHHWADSMHITQRVVTGGVTQGAVKLEASGFRGREPDRHRDDIERSGLDSIAVRASVDPTPRLALQISWAHRISPERLTPDIDERRRPARVIYSVPIGHRGFWSTAAIWANRRGDRWAGMGFMRFKID